MNDNEIKFCKKCGMKRSQKYNYCLSCGTPYTSNKPFEKTVVLKEPEKEPIQKFCPKCGMEVIPEDKYCIECGYRKPSKQIQTNTSNQTNNGIEKKTNKPKTIWVILQIISIINLVMTGPLTALVTIISFFLIFGDGFEADSVLFFMRTAGYLALSIFAVVHCSKKTSSR